MSVMDNYIDAWYDAALAAGQGFKSEAERQAYIDSLGDPEDHPMFCTDPEKIAKHPLADAFRQLNEEDKTQYELVIMYKEEANDLMKRGDKKGWRDAVVRYTHALTFIEPAIAAMNEEDKDSNTSTDGIKNAAGAGTGAVEEIEVKSQSVLQFEHKQRAFEAQQEAEQARTHALEQELARARANPAHTSGTKPVKADPSLSFDADCADLSGIEAKKAEAIKGMEGYAGEKVLTFEEVRHKAQMREKKIKMQAAGVTLPIIEQTRSQILTNRSLAQLSLKNYGMCIKDCDVALYFWPQNIKAYYRKCKALCALHRYELCVDAGETCRKVCDAKGADAALLLPAADQKALLEVDKVMSEAREQLKRIERDRLRVLVANEKRKKEIVHVYESCTGAQYRMQLGVPPGMPPRGTLASALNGKADLQAYKKNMSSNTRCYIEEGDSDGDDDASTDAMKTARRKADSKYLQQLEHQYPFVDPEAPAQLRFPAIFLYPQHNQLDIVQGCSAENMLVDYLTDMFPEIEDAQAESAAPWDVANEYVASKLICYIHMNGSESCVETAQEWLSYYDKDSVCPVGLAGNSPGRSLTFDKDKFCQVHLGCTVGQILACEGHIVPAGLLHVLVFVNKSKTHKRFLQTARKSRAAMFSLLPSGVLKEQL